MVSLSQMLDLDDDDGEREHIERASNELVLGLLGSRAESLRILASSHPSVTSSSRRRHRKPALDTMSELAELLDDDDVEVEGDEDDDHM